MWAAWAQPAWPRTPGAYAGNSSSWRESGRPREFGLLQFASLALARSKGPAQWADPKALGPLPIVRGGSNRIHSQTRTRSQSTKSPSSSEPSVAYQVRWESGVKNLMNPDRVRRVLLRIERRQKLAQLRRKQFHECLPPGTGFEIARRGKQGYHCGVELRLFRLLCLSCRAHSAVISAAPATHPIRTFEDQAALSAHQFGHGSPPF
jgi:hypothetical protein